MSILDQEILLFEVILALDILFGKIKARMK